MKNFLTISVYSHDKNVKLTGFVMPISFDELALTVTICRNIAAELHLTANFWPSDIVINLGGPRRFFSFAREVKRQHAKTRLSPYNYRN